jgi:hypothetical protein
MLPTGAIWIPNPDPEGSTPSHPATATKTKQGDKLVAEDGTTINAPDISRYENKRAAFKRNIEAIHGVKVGR